MSPSDEEARILLGKARDDRNAAAALAGLPSSALWIVGFHGQQAVEKAFKAVLASREIPYARTHNLSMLVALLAQHGFQAPGVPVDYAFLTPFGVAFRYDDTSDPNDFSLDVPRALDLIDRALAWAEDELGKGRQS